MSSNQPKLPFLPQIEPILPRQGGSREGAVIDSLRFSYDYDNTLEYSEDGRQIDFEFEDFPEYPEYHFGAKHEAQMILPEDINKSENKSLEDRNQTMDQSTVNRKLDIFEKYRNRNKQNQTSTKKQQTAIVDSFDRIFNMKAGQVSHPSSFLKKKNNQTTNNNSSQQVQPQTPTKLQNTNVNNNTTEIKVPQDKNTIQNNLVKNTNESNIQSVIKIDTNQNPPILPQQIQINLNPTKTPLQPSPPTFTINPNNQISTPSSLPSMTPLVIPAPSPNFILQPSEVVSPTFPIDNTNGKNNVIIGSPALGKNNVHFDYSQVSQPSNRSFSEGFNQLSISNVSINSSSEGFNNQIIPNIVSLDLKPVLPVNLSSSPSIQPQTTKPKPYSDPVIPSSFPKNPNPSQVYPSTPTQPQKNQSDKIIPISPIQQYPFPNQNAQQTPPIQSPQSNKSISPLLQEQTRIAPIFRKIHKMNSIYPNFNHPNIILQQQQKFTNILACIFLQSFLILQSLALKALDRLKQPKYYPTQLSSLSYFLNSGWQQEHYKEWQMINMTIRPHSNFQRNQINQKKLRDALVNYKDVILYYRDRKVELNSQENIKSYFRIRHKFWSLQRNMRSISEDIYRLYQEAEYPFFYYDYLNVLRSPLPSKNDERTIRYHQNVLKILITNKQRMEPLSSSEVGLAVKNKIQRELKFLFPF